MSELTGFLSELSLWAATYYPGRKTPPPELPGGPPPEAALFVLFANTTSAEHHLALVDLPVIREALERSPKGSPLRKMVTASWQRHLAAARARLAARQGGPGAAAPAGPVSRGGEPPGGL